MDVIKEADEPFEIVYPKNFEEIYYIASGSGFAQWETREGKVKEEKVNSGDTVVFPRDIDKHQVIATGTEKIVVNLMGSLSEVAIRKTD